MTRPVVPDVFAALTEERTTIAGVVQAALGVFPPMTTLGRPVEGLLLLQSLIDQPLSIQISTHLPGFDPGGRPLTIYTPRRRLTIMLPAAEVGLLHLPVTPQPPSESSQGYCIGVEVRLKPPDRYEYVRPVHGGETPSLLALSPFRAEVLRGVGFTARTNRRGYLTVPFGVLLGVVTAPDGEPMPRYEPLWTVRDLQQEIARTKEIAGEALAYARRLTVDDLYPILISHTRQAFSHVGLPLHLGEAMTMARLLTYVMTGGLDQEAGVTLPQARWFQRLCWLLAHHPTATQTPDQLVQSLYPNVVHDAALLGFGMVARRVAVNFGSEAEQHEYVEKLLAGLAGHLPLGLEHVYVPLVMAGVALTAQVRAPDEDPWRSLELLEEARSGRVRLADASFNEVFDLLNELIRQVEGTLYERRLPPA